MRVFCLNKHVDNYFWNHYELSLVVIDKFSKISKKGNILFKIWKRISFVCSDLPKFLKRFFKILLLKYMIKKYIIITLIWRKFIKNLYIYNLLHKVHLLDRISKRNFIFIVIVKKKNRKIIKITRKNHRNSAQIFAFRFQTRQSSLKNPCENIFLTMIAHIAGNGTLLQTNLLSGL